MDPIEKIIDRLKKEYGENGTYYLLETWYKKDLKNPSYKENIYNNIYGFLFGLQAVGYIEKSERKTAIDYLIEVIKEI